MQSPKEINNVFWEFYCKLYTSDKEPNSRDISSFLSNIPLLQLTTEQADMWTHSEHLMDKKLTPRPDGYFKIQFYCCFSK